MPDYTLRQLEYFVAVAESGSVTGAAQRVHLSQSAMSTALSDLERVLGVQLLVRHHARGVTLTTAGEELLSDARALLRQAQDLESAATAHGSGVTGRVTLGCFAILAPYVMPRLLQGVRERLPGVELATTEEALDGLAEGLRHGRLELTLGYDLGHTSGVRQRPLFSVPPHVVLPVDHRAAKRKAVTLQQLEGEPLVLLDLPHSRDYFARLFDAAGVVPDVRYRTHSAETARALVARGMGYTVLNLQAAHHVSLEGDAYAVVPLSTPLPADEAELRVVLAASEGNRLTRRAHAVSDVVTDLFSASPQPKR
ncbi:MAG TPA: LysR family transcriptional regulator [Candidatus Nanopelagicales bacterium]|nr:LysR family transcriptional regulator [Candidatus Nanopelagicales bacterium]